MGQEVEQEVGKDGEMVCRLTMKLKMKNEKKGLFMSLRVKSIKHSNTPAQPRKMDTNSLQSKPEIFLFFSYNA